MLMYPTRTRNCISAFFRRPDSNGFHGHDKMLPSLKHTLLLSCTYIFLAIHIKQLFAEGELNIEYLPIRSRDKYSQMFSELQMNNCSSINSGGEYKKKNTK